MSEMIKRGSALQDHREFGEKSLEILYQAGRDYYYLLNRGYSIKSASTFVGNHYLLSTRQRMALIRGIASRQKLDNRNKKEILSGLEHKAIHMDGFNILITLEVALSGSLLLHCMDGTIRDMAGLRGNYRLIDQTEKAILLIGDALEKSKIEQAIIYLDAPVSNSGRLKVCVESLLKDRNFELRVENSNQVDATLEKLENVVSSDSVILDRCKSWINLNKKIIEEHIGYYPYIDFEHALRDCFQ